MIEPLWILTKDDINFGVVQCAKGHWHALYDHEGETSTTLFTWDSQYDAILGGWVALQMAHSLSQGAPWTPHWN